MIYADTSFLFSLYALDDNTAAANDIYQADGRRPLLLTEWQELELANTLRLGLHRARRQRLPLRYQTANCLKRLHEDVLEGRLRRVKLDWPACARQAGKLSAEYTESLGIVMLDLWHLACAIELGADTFWTFDQEQAVVAHACERFHKVVGGNGEGVIH